MSVLDKPTHKRKEPPLIFIADDHPQLLQMAEILLTGEGYQCRLFSTPEEVLRVMAAERLRPDLLLTDYEMGSMNGLELVAHCRTTIPGLKTILVSGTVEEATILCHPVKVNQFLSKPYQPQALLSLVRCLLAEESPV
ncbi:MAG: response regulator [Verrucomicrobiota bacterium]